MPSTLHEHVEEILRQTAEDIKNEAQRVVPVDTGRLQRSIRIEDRLPQEISIKAGGNGVDYASYVEYGTSRMAPQMFMRPALENNKNNLRIRLKEAAERATKG